MNIHTLSKKITNCFISNRIIEESMSEVYQYGTELMLSCFFTTAFILAMSSMVDSFGAGFLYFVIFMPLKATAGGYHASSYTGCFLISCISYLVQTAIAKYLTYCKLPYPFWLMLLFLATFYILLNAPVKNSHHPVGQDVLRKNKISAIMLICTECLVTTILYILIEQAYLLNYVVLTIASIAIFMYPSIRKEDKHA